MERIYYFGGKAKDLMEDIHQHMTEAEELIMLEDEQMRHREEPISDPE